MARHAGFPVAITVEEAYLNQILWLEIDKLDPIARNQVFALPSIVPLGGGRSVRLSGIAFFDPRPNITLRRNPGNRIDMSASAVAFLSAALEQNGVAQEERTWKIRIDTTVQVGVDVEIDAASDAIYLRWQPAGSVVGSLQVTKLEGAPIPDFLIAALNSPTVLAAMNLAIQAIGPVRISGKLFQRRLRHVQHADFHSTGTSLFEWFTITADIVSVPLLVLDGCVSVGVNFSNFSAGNPGALVDLNKNLGDSVQYGAGPPSFRPLLVPGNFSRSEGDIHVLVNADWLRGIVDDVSRQIRGTQVAPSVKLMSIAVRPEFFDKPLRGREIGLRVDIGVELVGAISASGTIFLQVYELSSGGWFIYVGHSQIEAPWWVDAGVIVLGAMLALALPFLTPLLAIGVIAVTDGTIPDLVAAGNGQAQQALGNGQFVAPSPTLGTATGLQGAQVTSYEGVRSIHLSSEGVGLSMSNVLSDVRFEAGETLLDAATLATTLNAGSPAPFRFVLTLSNRLSSLGSQCSVQTIVTRVDTGEEVARSEGPYVSNRVTSLDHMTEELYFVDVFRVQAKIFVNRVNLEGLLFAADTTVTVTDAYNRHHPFVTWAGHVAHFRNPNNPSEFWARQNYPEIHRTAASARCLVLKQRAAKVPPGKPPFVEYRDALDFDFAEVPVRRRKLCDYCFFGGPTRTQPFPREDWFT